jgi:hypothetical protein
MLTLRGSLESTDVCNQYWAIDAALDAELDTAATVYT